MTTNNGPFRFLSRRYRRHGAAAAGSLFLALTAVACSSDASRSAAPLMAASASSTFHAASGTAHGLSITGGYVPQPASPDVASAYLTISNTTSTAVQLTKVTTSVTRSVMAMDEVDKGSVGSMTDLPRVDIPAHGSYQFVPNHAHLMLQNPTTLKAGDHVKMTLTFSTLGSMTITLPVVPFNELPSGVPSTYSSAGTAMPSMSMPAESSGTPMPGMSMSSSHG